MSAFSNLPQDFCEFLKKKYPEIFKEIGENVEFAQWSGLFIPSGVSNEITETLRAAAKLAANDPRVKSVLDGTGSPIQYLDAPEFKTYWDLDAKKMSDIVKKIGKVE